MTYLSGLLKIRMLNKSILDIPIRRSIIEDLGGMKSGKPIKLKAGTLDIIVNPYYRKIIKGRLVIFATQVGATE
jgi:hypothetical protein